MDSDNVSQGNSLFYNLLLFLITGFICALTIVNAVVYGKIANGDITYGTVTPGGARALEWINAVFAAITGCLALYYLYLSIFSREYRLKQYEAIKRSAMNTYQNVRNYRGGLYRGSNQVSPMYNSPGLGTGGAMAFKGMM